MSFFFYHLLVSLTSCLFEFGKFGKFGKFEVGLDLVYDCTDDLVGAAVLRVIRRSDEVHSLLAQELLCYVDLLLAFRVVDP